MTNLDEKSWIVLKPEEQSIKEKIERLGTPLKDWDVDINYGIKTGYNEAFIIDGDTKDQLIAEDPKSAEIIKPILRGRDIKRYKAEFADLWLIATFPSLNIDIDNYPAVKKHLEQFLPKIRQTGETFLNEKGLKEKTRKKTGNKWFETQDQIGYYQEFEKEKIIYMEIQTDNKPAGYEFPCYAYDANNTFVLNTAYIMTGNYIKYILGVLNSKLGETLVKYYVTQLQKRQFRMLDMYVKHFPIREFKENFMQIENVVDLILSKKQNNQDTTAEEQQIDLMVYHLYELTYDEVLVIDPEPPFSRAEYENAAINVAG